MTWVISSRSMRWMGHSACMEKMKCVYRGFVGKPEQKRPHGRHRLRWEDILQWIIKNQDARLGMGLIWLILGTSGRLLWKQWWTSSFCKIQGICWLAEKLLAAHEGLCFMELSRWPLALWWVVKISCHTCIEHWYETMNQYHHPTQRCSLCSIPMCSCLMVVSIN